MNAYVITVTQSEHFDDVVVAGGNHLEADEWQSFSC